MKLEFDGEILALSGLRGGIRYFFGGMMLICSILKEYDLRSRYSCPDGPVPINWGKDV